MNHSLLLLTRRMKRKITEDSGKLDGFSTLMMMITRQKTAELEASNRVYLGTRLATDSSD